MNIGDFSNIQEISRGGMGTVYQGYLDNRKVALKEIRRDFLSESELILRFQQEARVLDMLDHPAIVKIIRPSEQYYDERYFPAFEWNGSLYMAMDFVEGTTLDQYVKNYGGPLPETIAVNLMSRILDTMEYIRLQKLVHRDIKPSNIIIKPDLSICIIDFGIAKDIGTNGLTTGKSILGTNGYMSPEQAEGGLTVDFRTDIYSLGCVLFYMLTARHAIQNKSSDMETRLSIIQDAFPRAKDFNPSISDKVQSCIDRATDKNMLKRFQSPREFHLQLTSGAIETVSQHPYDQAITVGRDSSNDIVVSDSFGKVSRRHLEITWREVSEGTIYIFKDRSTNGTRINNQFINGSSTEYFMWNRTGEAPAINLAGVYMLKWADIANAKLKFSQKQAGVTPQSVNTVSPTPPAPAVNAENKLKFGLWIICLLCPLAGWIMSGVWKKEYPEKARTAFIVSTVSFLLFIIIRFTNI